MKAKLILLCALFTVLVLTPTLVVAIDNGTDAPSSNGTFLPDYAIIKLRDPSLSSYIGGISGYPATAPLAGQKLDLTTANAHRYSDYLAGQRASAKSWLATNAPYAQVTWEFSVTMNALVIKLNGHNMQDLSSTPGAVRIYPDSLHTVEMNRSTQLINAPALWSRVGGQANAGAGIKIGIIDTGIDNTHPYLTDPTLSVPAGFPKCDARDAAICSSITSNKVIVAKVYNEPDTNFDAHAAQDHGSHVSGIAAGVAGTSCGAGFATDCTLSGIAPKAWLGNYNVFPGTVTNAASDVIAKAVDDAVVDGMDVLNLSLGGGAETNDPLVDSVNAAVDAGLSVAIAAGNSGPGDGTVDSPGIAQNVITVGASTNPHFLGITVSTTALGNFGAALGQFNNFVPAVTAGYLTTNPARGCSAISTNLTGKIALIRRGTCTFSTKIRNAQIAGAIGALIINSQQGDPTAMAKDGTPNQPTIPAAMVSITNGNAMGSSGTITVDGSTKREFFSDGAGADILASFSSWGPANVFNPVTKTIIVQDNIKPDLVAPGVNVYSSILMSSCSAPPCFAFFSGTSMATPHVAGSAAVMKQLHPDWSPNQIKSALVVTAHRPVKLFTDGSTGLTSDPMITGAGRLDLGAAASISALVAANKANQETQSNGIGKHDDSLPSIDFGTVSAGTTAQRFADVGLTSLATTPITYTLTIIGDPGVTTSTSTVTVVNAGTGRFSVTLTLDPKLPAGDYWGDIILSGGATPLRIAWWYRVA